MLRQYVFGTNHASSILRSCRTKQLYVCQAQSLPAGATTSDGVERTAAQVSTSSVASTSAPRQRAAPKATKNWRVRGAEKLRRRTKGLNKTIHRLESKLLSSHDLEWEEELVLERLLELSNERMERLSAQDMSRPDVAAQKLLAQAQDLDVDAELLAKLVEGDSRLLLLKPLELQARLQLLGSMLQVDGAQDVLELALEYPQLLSRSSSSLSKRLTEMDALFKSRGLSLSDMARRQPDLLLQAAGSLRLKLDALPAALDLPPRRARDVVAKCPQLLRRSPATVHERFKLLQKMFDSVPRNFLSELVCQEPKLLCLSGTTLAAKFAALTKKYGSFQDDIVDMILVDANVFFNAQPAPKQAAAQQQQRQQSQAAAAAARKLSGVSKLLHLASELEVPLMQVLQLCSEGSSMCNWRPGQAAASLATLGEVLGLTSADARVLVRKQARLLELTREQLQQRVAKLREVLEGSSSAAAAAAAAAPLPPLLSQHPELLLQEPQELEGRIRQLGQQLGLPLAQLPALLASCPSLVLEPSSKVSERLGAVRQMLGGVPASLVAELVTKEPLILSVPLRELEDTFEELASSFGSFREDALDVILADPSMLLKARAERMAASQSGSQGMNEAGPEQLQVSGPSGGKGKPERRDRGRAQLPEPTAAQQRGLNEPQGSSDSGKRRGKDGAKRGKGTDSGRYLKR